MNQRHQALGLDPRKMSPLYRQALKQGVTDTVTFQPFGRNDVADLRYEDNILVRKIFPMTAQFVPYVGKPYEEMLVVDVGNSNGVIISRTIPLNPFGEQFSVEEWLSDEEYFRRLQRSVYVEPGRKKDPVAFVDGRLVLLHERSLPPVMNAQNKVIIIEDLRLPRMYVLSEEQVRQVQESTGSALATLGQALGLFSAAEQETVREIIVKAKNGLHAASIRTDEGLEKRERRHQIWDALGNPDVMGLARTLTMDCTPKDLKRSAQQLLASVNTDSQDVVHPYITKMAPFKASYVMRRAMEEKLAFFRRVGEKAMKIANGWEKQANLEALPKANEGSKRRRSHGGRGRNGGTEQVAETQQAPVAEAATVEAPVTITTGKPEESDDWGSETEAQATAPETASAPETLVVEGVGEVEVTEDVPVAQATETTETAPAGSVKDIEAKIAAINVRLETEKGMLPNTKKFLTQDLTRLRGQLKAANAPKTEKAPKAPRAEKTVLKGLANLGALAGKSDASEG